MYVKCSFINVEEYDFFFQIINNNQLMLFLGSSLPEGGTAPIDSSQLDCIKGNTQLRGYINTYIYYFLLKRVFHY